jgi:DNA-binding NarL/FixJ family response regulator
MDRFTQKLGIHRKLRIVIADDHELIRRGIRDLLQARRDWKVVSEAANGRQALEKTKKLKPDLIILDIGMPNLDGLEVTRRIRAAVPDTKILILTMHESSRMIRRVLEAGARGYVLKSDLGSYLVKAVKAVSRGKVYLTPKASEIVLEGLLTEGAEAQRSGRSQVRPTPRETEIIRLLAEGKPNKLIATELGITVRTVETHRAKIMLKLGLRSLTQLVHYAIRHDLVSPQPF